MQHHFLLFRSGEKIYAAWSVDDYPSYHELDRYDAGPDGLSGRKEGFYFADQLLPYNIPIKINGIVISPNHYPPCLDSNELPCSRCTFFVREKCPVLADINHIDLTRAGFDAYRKLIPVPRGWIIPWSPNKLLIFLYARKELIEHGRSMHYKLLAKLLRDRHPEIKV